jgi:predicted metalloprotease with PDZ domain
MYLGVTFGKPKPNGSVELVDVEVDGPVGLAGGQAGDLLISVDGASAVAARCGWEDGTHQRTPGVRMSWLVEARRRALGAHAVVARCRRRGHRG